MNLLGGAWLPLLVATFILGVEPLRFQQSCGGDDFQCSNNKCIERSRVCNKVQDCPNFEDERDCDCGSDEFRCESDGICIEARKRCDGTVHCSDRSDELNCACSPTQWQCDHGTCIKRSQRCDGRVDCPTDRSDERNCIANGYFRCRNGKLIPDNLRCNRQYDCAPGDFSDEQNCPCGASDFKCDNGHCIAASKHCDKTHDCQDGSDERDCLYGTVCMAYEYECTSGMCVQADSRCNGTVECDDGTDETSCPCKRDQYPCRDGSCINIAFLCNGREDCSKGEDEYNCHTSCPAGRISCPPGSSVACALRCDNRPECDGGEDEEDCPGACDHKCSDNTCLSADKICNQVPDCSDSSDETDCDFCDGASDFRCDSGECLSISARCNKVPECQDESDERSCDFTMTADSEQCNEGEFQCVASYQCIPLTFHCDGNDDCDDKSDESNCLCPNPDSFQCRNGQCIDSYKFCNGENDCDDGSDETDCPILTTESPALIPPTSIITTTMRSTDNRYPTGGYPPNYDSGSRIPDSTGQPNYPGSEGQNGPTGNIQPGGSGYPDSRGQPGGSGYPDNREPAGGNGYPDDRRQPGGSGYPDDRRQPDGNGYPDNRGQPGGNEYPDDRRQPDGNGSPDSRGHPGGSGYPDDRRQPDSNGYPDNRGQPGGSGYPDDRRQPDGSGYPDSRGQPNGSGYPDDRRQPDGNGYPDSRGQPGGSGYPDDRRQPDSNGYPDNRGPLGGSGYPDDRRQPDSNGYPDNRGQPNGSGYPDDRRQPDGNGYPDSRGQPGGSGYPDDRRQPDGNGYSDSRGQPNSSGYPDDRRQPDGNGYPDSRGQPGSSGYPDDRRQLDGNGYPDSRGQPGSSGYPDGRGQPGGSGYPDNRGQAEGSLYPDSRGLSGNGGYPDIRGQSGNSGYPDGGGQSGGSGYPDSRGRPGGSGYPDGSDSYGDGSGSGGCSRANQWRCENGPCIESFRRCDGRIDCPFDYSDELDCPSNSPIALNLKTYPKDQSVRHGGDVVFQCRDEGPQRAYVRWTKQGGRIKEGSIDVKGRLEMNVVSESDSGIYICQAVNFIGQPGSEARVSLFVEAAPITYRPPSFPVCQPYEATCSSGQCIPKSSVCNDRIDCDDGSDEDNCHHQGMCEPNQFKCSNNKCVLKTWVCDSEDDCGDGSDEQNCGVVEPGKCSPVEHTCQSGDQCIPKSFHCDGQSDCLDKSDEIGCDPIHITSPPKPSNLRLNPGDTLTLSCTAVGMPTPVISWRLNWGHVPPQCTSTSNNGEGVLTCPNILPEHSGAYSCEALNNKGTNFAVPDAIVFVNKTDVCRQGYFNSEARTESECIRCFCFARATECRSADLFTYNMPTPLGQGGTRLVGIKLSDTGEVEPDYKVISNQYHYQPQWNGATVTKYGEGSSWYNSHPYLTLPESYTKNQLKSYGGHIKYTLTAQTQVYGMDESVPTIIIKGKYRTLFHTSRVPGTRSFNIEARLTPEDWMKGSPNGFEPASREDIMMGLDDIEMILLRADLNNAGVSITDFAMESADHINMNLGVASLVEECSCPKQYDGLSCQKCAAGYVRKVTGPWLGVCEAESCPPGTYGDPSRGLPCQTCPCPLTNRDNQFAGTCALGPDGSVICDCFQGYEGQHCESCASGYQGNPLVPGDSCKPAVQPKCNAIGTKSIRPPDECVCKDNVKGPYCNDCKDDSYFLSPDFRHGCARCFCMGVPAEKCVSSNYRRKTINVQFNVPQVVDQLKVYRVNPSNIGSFKYTAPIETELKPQLYRGDVSLNEIDRSRSTVYYWSMPASFAANKVTSYGGFLRYTLKNVPTSTDPRSEAAADVHLISDNSVSFKHFGKFPISYDGILNASIQLLEENWQRPDGKEVLRENFLMGLADVKTILIKATYSPNAPLALPVSASIEIAEPDGNGPTAFHVEYCTCPKGYTGTSCEDCAPGYTRDETGLYLQNCVPCECNGKSSMCHPENGVCIDCTDNTDGDNCEVCKSGYERDRYNNCVPLGPSTTRTCTCDVRGISEPCDDSGNCYCKPNVEGPLCDRCRPGAFGLDYYNPDGCLSCYCSGVTKDCHEGNHYTRWSLPAPVYDVDFGGFTLTDLNAQKVIKDNFMPLFKQSELIYNFGSNSDEELYWSLPVFPGNRVLSYGGSLSLRQQFSSEVNELSEQGVDVVLDGGDISIYWTNPNQFQSGVSYSYQVPLREQGWYVLNTVTPATRYNFMQVLKNLKRVLVRATVVRGIYETRIADVSMDTATPNSEPGLPAAKGIEICLCPTGYSGTSCESCTAGYYKDQTGHCSKCKCNGHNCHLDNRNQVICNCQPPYVGPDCTTTGLVMELHPKLREVHGDSYLREVTFTCKYSAPEPLTITFYHMGDIQEPRKYYNESQGMSDGSWHGEHSWHTTWDTREQGEEYECHVVTARGRTLGILTTSLPEPGGEVTPAPTTFRPPPEARISVRITSPALVISSIGSSVNFTCQAQSLITRGRLPVVWIKSDGELPLERTHINGALGLIVINNLQVSDSGRYICETKDGISTEQASVTLKVPGNEMTMPRVEVVPAFKEAYEGDRIELECRASGNPAPAVKWQRGSNKPLPLSAQFLDKIMIIEYAQSDDGGEYRCIGSNALGYHDSTAIITIRQRPQYPRESLTVSNKSPSVDEGQSIRITCTGTSNVPTGSIDWIRQDNALFASNVRSENGVLYIDYATPDDQGIYICQSKASDVPAIPVLVTVVAQPNPEDNNYNVTVSLKQLRIPTGGSGSIECDPVSGRPLPLIKWSKHGTNNQFSVGSSQRGNSLIIYNAQDEDAGYYICEGTVNGNAVGNKIFVYVEIERREPPVVKIWPEGEQAVPLGGEHIMNCRVLGGIPAPDVTWSRSGGRPLSTYTQIQPQNVLRFKKIEVNDEGEYTCTARNDAGTVSASAVIKVRSPPEITITPNNYIVVPNGEPVNVECRASGYPEPTVSIVLSEPYRVIVPETPGMAALRIPAASQQDDGYYTCTATSVAGSTTDQFAISVDRGDGGYDTNTQDEGSGDPIDPGYPDPIGPDEMPNNLIAFDGDSQTILECGKPGQNVRWARADFRPLQPNARQDGTLLTIAPVSKSDSGQYICQVIDAFGAVEEQIYFSVEVFTPLKITINPPKQTVRPGQSPTVECIVEGDEIIDVSWRPKDRQPSSRMETRGSTLIFHNIEVEDAGQYECYVHSRFKDVSNITGVYVIEDTEGAVVSHANEQRAHVGAAVELSCNVMHPDMRISWTKDSRPLPRSVKQNRDGSLSIRLAQKSDSGRYVCSIRDRFGRLITSNYVNLHIQGNPDSESLPLVQIEQPQKAFRAGDNVDVLCRSRSPTIKVNWLKVGTNQYVETIRYGDGAMLSLKGVSYSDAGVYRCVGTDTQGRSSYGDFELEVQPGPGHTNYPGDRGRITYYTAALRQIIDIVCPHDLEGPVSYEWKREFLPLAPELRTNQPSLHLESVTEADAGLYVCRVSNSRGSAEARAILTVTGVVPRFGGQSFISLPPLKDAYKQFDIEISFKPADRNGLIFYNSENQGREGDYIALQLKDQIPEFVMNSGVVAPVVVKGDRPLQLNVWHTIRLSRTKSKVTMDVDNFGPFISEFSDEWVVLDLKQPLYIGGVPDYDQLPAQLTGASGFIGCVSMLILAREEKNIMMDSYEQVRITQCDTCLPNLCLNEGVCQEARNERGHVCICAPGFAGLNCARTGEACRPGLCGPGKCSDSDGPKGYKCACPVTHTGTNCETKQSIEYPAFTGSAYLAIKPPRAARTLRMSMKINAASPVTDGIIMYCAESPRGYGGFTSLAVHDGRLEFRYDLGGATQPVVLVSDRLLAANDWTDVLVARTGSVVSLRINTAHSIEQRLDSPKQDLNFDTPIFVGGVDDESITLNNNTGVTGGFNGCIKDFMLHGEAVDIVNSTIQSANVRECIAERGDTPDESCHCRNGGTCNSDFTCECPLGFTGEVCERRASYSDYNPCDLKPCKNGGICRRDLSSRMNHTCDCPLGFAGVYCQMSLILEHSVSFNGTGYLELPANLLNYDNLAADPAMIALLVHTTKDGVLIYQKEVQSPPNYGDFILLRIDRGYVVLEWDLGGGMSSLSVLNVFVSDGERHQIIAKLLADGQVQLTVDGVEGLPSRGTTNGFATKMNADSNIYLGGIPDYINQQGYPGFTGCIEQLELMDLNRGLDLGHVAVTGRNAQRCKDPSRY